MLVIGDVAGQVNFTTSRGVCFLMSDWHMSLILADVKFSSTCVLREIWRCVPWWSWEAIS